MQPQWSSHQSATLVLHRIPWEGSNHNSSSHRSISVPKASCTSDAGGQSSGTRALMSAAVLQSSAPRWSKHQCDCWRLSCLEHVVVNALKHKI